jgi:acetylornithine deacetylase/succinyl-diaminopimelate desuccinylase-like protein
MNMTTDTILDHLKAKVERDKWLDTITSTRELILSNLAMLSEVPAQTMREQDRASLILDRYICTTSIEPTTDKTHNVIGKLRGKRNGRRILLFTHMDHQFGASVDQNVTITEDRAYGAGIAEDTTALAVLITMPDIIDRLGLEFAGDIILLATTRSHGRGDFGGIRHFMDENEEDIDFAVNMESVPLGKINYTSLSRVRCDISCRIDAPQNSPWGKITNTSAIMISNEVINSLAGIRLPRQPKTYINIGMISGGERYSTVSTRASVHLEVLSEDDDIMDHIVEEIHDRCIDVGAKHGVDISVDFFGRHHAAGLTYSHPLVKSAVEIIDHLGHRPIVEYSNSEVTVPLAHSVPSVNLGLTTGMEWSGSQSFVDLPALPSGILQVIMLLQAIDQGHCDE